MIPYGKIRLCICFVLGVNLLGCSVSKKLDEVHPEVNPPQTFCRGHVGGELYDYRWWQEYQSDELNSVVENALANNFTLKSNWWKTVEACAAYKIAGSFLKPQISSDLAFQRSKAPLLFGVPPNELLEVLPEDFHTTIYSHSFFLTYEFDIWNRIHSKRRAACMNFLASQEDLESSALMLAGTVVDAWISLLEMHQQKQLIQKQQEVSRQLLFLVEARYGVGEALAIDVSQQRLQFESTIESKFPVMSKIEVLENQLSVLTGTAPCDCDFIMTDMKIELPKNPYLGNPFDLLLNRPDLRAYQRRLMQADSEVAAAIADRLPALALLIDFTNFSQEIADLFKRSSFDIVVNLMTPILDGGRRKSEVLRRKAILFGLLNAYTQAFLEALEEVESSLSEEKFQKELIAQIEVELDYAERSLTQATRAYVNGLNDYLTVISSIQVKQNLERRLVSENANLLRIRNKLYKALGGKNWN